MDTAGVLISKTVLFRRNFGHCEAFDALYSASYVHFYRVLLAIWTSVSKTASVSGMLGHTGQQEKLRSFLPQSAQLDRYGYTAANLLPWTASTSRGMAILDGKVRTAVENTAPAARKSQPLQVGVKKAQGTVSYTKAGGSQKLTVSKTTGKVTVKKGTKKGTYKIKIKVSVAGNALYKAGAVTKTVVVRVK